jgi:hypothetical protein
MHFSRAIAQSSLAVGPLDITFAHHSRFLNTYSRTTDLDVISSQLTAFYEVVAKKASHMANFEHE